MAVRFAGRRIFFATSSTCAADGERDYSVLWDGKDITLFAHDFDGKELWTYPMGEFRSQHGPGGSPMVHDGKVVYVNDQDGASEVICVEARTGREVWKKPRRAFRAWRIIVSTPWYTRARSSCAIRIRSLATARAASCSRSFLTSSEWASRYAVSVRRRR